MPTLSKTLFDANSADVVRLLEIHADIAGDAPGRKYGVEVLNKSAIVLICAFWEAYIEDVLAEALDHIVTHCMDFNRLPTDLRRTIAKALKQDAHDLSPWKLAGAGWQNELRSNLGAATAKYLGKWNTPKSTNIRDLFAQALGLPDLPASWHRPYLTSQAAAKKLDDFVTLRGAIAHRGNAGQSVQKSRVQGFLDHVRDLVTFSEAAVNSHVQTVSGRTLF